ncbi:hypothetical protein LguiA_017527 [Lonicera macranthoides]
MFKTLLLPQINTILIMNKPPLMSSFGIKERRHMFALSSAVCESYWRFFYPANFTCFGAKTRNYTHGISCIISSCFKSLSKASSSLTLSFALISSRKLF